MFYSHRFDPETPLEETMRTLDLFVRQGKALYVGVSNYDLENSKKAVKILKDLGTPCFINQLSYSMFNCLIEDNIAALNNLEFSIEEFNQIDAILQS
jgi:L-glyceraldehyde 3-phosphate reductase